ncbi:electron transport complex subunit E [Marinobacter nanhaiticus D15-8W]|uniref:Ion-translocating oxidoreductase complex subunit E n=1 Tax=Marinobacter nanhaiticus D15-8W TaxID=626887 RepID=N6WSE3_9GAMM|nr:electron transport complex subunit E [Marinobacter nanhaiticus]ENO14471.1 electron transport complex subunit RsxE [Marinobacter nanhaiticus D15-8W]BES71864.1 electron transport complex subunit E [Marinobacter nanhaiticus D15-8W]
MANKTPIELIKDGLWTNNPALVQVLGLCPLLAVTGTVVNGIGLGLATLLVLVGSNLSVSLIRNFVSKSVRLPAFVMIIASFVTCAELLMQAFTYELYQILGIFIPLIVTNCAILGRADAFASRNPILPSMLDGFMMGLGFLLVLIALGGIRELIGRGTLLTDMDLIFGPVAADWRIQVFEDYANVLFMVLPPGAFVGLGFLIALKNGIDGQIRKRREAREVKPIEVGSKRVRVTGNVS